MTSRRRLAAFAAAATLAIGSVTWGAAPAITEAAATPASPAYAPQPHRRYITIGATGAVGTRQFTEAEYQEIATNYEVVVFVKGHAGWDVELHHEAARRLVEINPGIQVYAYMSTKFWFDSNDWGVEINPDWLLRDRNGKLVPKIDDREESDQAFYIDLADPAYRAWALEVAQSWMDVAPYAGVRFDAADPIGDFGRREIRMWQRKLTPEALAAYNAGIVDLFTRADALLPGVLFNGISPSDIRGPDRGLSMLAFTDGAMDESFCVDSAGEPRNILDDIGIMADHADKNLQFRAGLYPDAFPPDTVARLGRFCLGAFLMGWQPGSSYFNFGIGYGVDQLTQPQPEADLALGQPTGSFAQAGNLLRRQFEHGSVFVNIGSMSATASAPADSDQHRDGTVVATLGQGDSFSVPAQDAVYLMDR